MPSATKNGTKPAVKSVEVTPKSAKGPIKNGAVVTKGKAVINTKVEKPTVAKGADAKLIKNQAKTIAAAKEAPKTAAKKSKDTPKGYTPVKNTLRFFMYQSLKRGGSAKKLKSRAAELAAKAGIEKYGDVSAYKGFDVAFFVGMLKERGVEVEDANNKYKLA